MREEIRRYPCLFTSSFTAPKIVARVNAQIVYAYSNREATRSTPEDEHYVAAVVEYHVRRDLQYNLASYVSLVGQAAAQNADIVVFPEMTLTSGHSVPVPIHGLLQQYPVPALNPEHYDEVLVRLSTAARVNQIYVVINIEELMNCTVVLEGENCPNNTEFRFNTNVVFDRNGAVIDRYRKINLFGERSRTPALTPDLGYFETDFGVRFGHFICFDLMFQVPAIQTVQKLNVTDVIFTTMWFSEMPYLTGGPPNSETAESPRPTALSAELVLYKGYVHHSLTWHRVERDVTLHPSVEDCNFNNTSLYRLLHWMFDFTNQGCYLFFHKIGQQLEPRNWRTITSSVAVSSPVQIQEAYAYAQNVNFLAAGANNVLVGSAGSGIYSGKLGALASVMPGTDTTKLLVERVPKIPGRVNWTYTGPEHDLPRTQDNLYLKRDPSVSAHVTRVLVPGYQEFSLSHNEDYTYRAAAFDGVRTFDGFASGGARACAVYACVGDPIESCGVRFDTYIDNSAQSFEELFISARLPPPAFDPALQSADAAYFPIGLDVSIMPLRVDDYEVQFPTQASPDLYNVSLVNSEVHVLSFGIWGRTFDRDGLEPTAPGSSAVVTSSCTIIVLAILKLLN
ncbi:Vanin-like protein 2 [Eumeta japonica]|uniref:Vanin-like protein 2 n=1 Tax=Eumeta variegata TaxID=151549 RepID=A0A4C2AF86_EUMVA|nr:Vanin-like protein 2 [Eumeta japonica]